jgi:non-ribosomal peptide synthetase component F
MLARRFLASAAKHAAAQPSTRLAAAQHQLAAGFATYQQSARIVHKSPHPEIDLPNATIWEVLQERAEQMPDKPAVINGLTHEEVSFRELLESSKRVAVALAKDGVKRGDVSAVQCPVLLCGDA